MPRISRIRVANIRYDSNPSKLYPDVTLETQGDNLLVVLANGGGKTLLLQLVLQVILPNAVVKNRQVRELLQDRRYTGHVLVEWLLDTPEQEFLLTGFCFTNGRDGEPIRYFNFTHRYQQRNPLDLGNFPLLDEEHRPVGYHDLYQFLKERVNARLAVWDRRGDYQRELENYHIYAREWENIRLTNSSEGGVDEFFKNSKSTLKLLENLLIPAIEDVLFETDAAKKELAEAFHRHRQSLLELPEIRKNLDDFELIRQKGRDLLDSVAILQDARKEVEGAARHVTGLWRGFDASGKEAAARLDRLKDRESELEQLRAEVAWKFDSHRHYAKSLETEEGERRLLQHRQTTENAREHLESARQQENQLEALYLLAGVRKKEAEIRELQTKIEVATRSRPEKEALLRESRGRLAGTWHRFRRQEEIRLRDLERQLTEQRDHIDRTGDETNSLHEERVRLERNLGGVVAWIQETEQLRAAWENEGQEEAARAPHAAIARWRSQAEDLAGRRAESRETIEALAGERERLSEERQRLVRLSESRQHALDLARKQQAEFELAKEGLEGRLTRWGIHTHRLPVERERVEHVLKELGEDIRDRLFAASARHHQLNGRLALAKGRDYYLPHQALEQVQYALQEKGIAVVAGAEWLSRHPCNEGDPLAYLWGQPLLPYSIVVNAEDLGRCRSVLEQLAARGEIEPDFPLLLMVHNEATLQPSVGKPGLNRLLVEGAFIYQDHTLCVFTSPEVLETWRRQVVAKCAEVEVEVADLQQQEKDLHLLGRDLQSFFGAHPEDFATRLVARLKDLSEGITRIENEEAAAAHRHRELLDKIRHLEQEAAAFADERMRLVSLMGKLEPYRLRFDSWPDRLRERTELEVKGTQVKDRLEQLQRDLQGYQAKEWELAQLLREDQRELDRRGEEILRLLGGEMMAPSPEEVPAPGESWPLEEPLPQIEAQVKGLLSSLDQEEKRIEEWRTGIAKSQQAIGEGRARIATLGIPDAWLSQNERPVPWSYVVEQSHRVTAAEAQFHQADVVRQEKEKQVTGLRAELRILEDNIQKAFDRPPCRDFHPALHESQRRDLEDKGKELALESTEVQEQMVREKRRLEALDRARRYVETEWPPFRETFLPPADPAQLDQAVLADPENAARDGVHHWRRREDARERQRLSVDRVYGTYRGALAASENEKVRLFQRNVAELAGEERLYDYIYMQGVFGQIETALDRYAEHHQERLAAIEVDRQELIRRSVVRAERMAGELVEIAHYSQIELYGREIQMLRLEQPATDPKGAPEAMSRYIDSLIEDLTNRRQAGATEDELRRDADVRLNARNILNVLVPLAEIRVRVIKPKQEESLQNLRISYEPWDQVARWSAGEEYTAYMSMFIVLISYLRRRISGTHKAWKVILADNPFGKASSPHILEPVFTMARQNQVQYIALTAHREQNILERFRVVYSLKLVKAYDKEVIRVENIESGHYALDLGENGTRQVRFSL